MNRTLAEYKKKLMSEIYILGYEDLRYSIFAGENNNRSEYQVRIEKISDSYEVYITADRASVMGKYKTKDINEAMEKFLEKIHGRVWCNRDRVADGEDPEYNCVLWGTEWLSYYKKRTEMLELED